jgi:hypothetical protein
MASANHRHPLPNRPLWVSLTLALLTIVIFSSCAFPEQGFDGSLAGTYYLNGVDPEGTEYGGTMEIMATDQPDVYDVQWIITGSIQTGTGTVTGNEFDVEWEVLEGYNSSSHGTAHYDISAEGELNGERTVAGEEGTGTEEAFPIR